MECIEMVFVVQAIERSHLFVFSLQYNESHMEMKIVTYCDDSKWKQHKHTSFSGIHLALAFSGYDICDNVKPIRFKWATISESLWRLLCCNQMWANEKQINTQKYAKNRSPNSIFSDWK